jgi:quercetin dioxygenase-like cupin family protein
MEPRGKAVTGRRQFLCGCCATLASVGLGAGYAAAATDPVVAPVESAPFHLEVFENEYVRFLNVLIPPGKVGSYHRHSIDFVYLILESTDRYEATVLDEPMALVSLKKGHVLFGGYSKAPLIHQTVVRGDFVWQAAGTTRAVRNVGTSPVEWVEFELK